MFKSSSQQTAVNCSVEWHQEQGSKAYEFSKGSIIWAGSA